MIKFLGHASIYIKTDEVSIVTDPWFSKSGAFQSSWFQFPDNTDIDFSWKEELDYVCISHEHQDHFDLQFLKTLNSKTKIVIPDYHHKRFYNSIKENLPNDIIEVQSRKKFMLGDVEYYPLIQVPMGQDDAALIFRIGDEVVVDTNDMKPSENDIKWINKNFDTTYLFTQFSGASWYPLVYDYDEEKMYKLSRDKRIFKYKSITNLIDELNPNVYIPCAGPPCFLDDEVFELNFEKENTFPTQANVHKFLRENNYNSVLLMPDDEISTEMDYEKISKNNLKNECFEQRYIYLYMYKQRRKDLIKEVIDYTENVSYSLLQKCKKYFYPLLTKSIRLCDKIGGSILLNVNGNINEKIIIDFDGGKNSVRYYDDDEYFYEFILESRWLNLILDKIINWEDLFLSLRFKAKRQPDEYSEHLMAFLKLAEPNAHKNYEDFHFNENFDDEVFILKHNKDKYKCQKYCPHAKADLSKGDVVDGNLVCPRHNWKFKLKDGKCLNNNSKITMELQ
tara:strand:+ start:2111 stop:3628 length:1518 start_codon:yes stop_codon:yes gene_type:complete